MSATWDQPQAVSQFPTGQSIDDARERRGPRTFWALRKRGVHYDLCDGLDCPCLREGRSMLAASHLDVLDHFCRVDPELVRERLALADPDGTEASA